MSLFSNDMGTCVIHGRQVDAEEIRCIRSTMGPTNQSLYGMLWVEFFQWMVDMNPNLILVRFLTPGQLYIKEILMDLWMHVYPPKSNKCEKLYEKTFMVDVIQQERCTYIHKY